MAAADYAKCSECLRKLVYAPEHEEEFSGKIYCAECVAALETAAKERERDRIFSDVCRVTKGDDAIELTLTDIELIIARREGGA